MSDENVSQEPNQANEPEQTKEPAGSTEQPAEKLSTAPDAPDFLSGLPADLQREPSLQKYKSQEEMITGFLEAQRRLGRSITIPPEDATAEQKQEFYDKLAKSAPELSQRVAPESVDAYEVPEGVELDDSQFREVALKAGLTNEQYSKVISLLNEENTVQTQQLVQQHNEQVKALHEKWGHAYDERYQIAWAGAREMAEINNDHQMFADGSISPGAIETYYEFGVRLGAEGQNFQGKEVVTNRKTPAEIHARINEILEKTTGANSLAPSSPEYKALMAEKRELYRELPENKQPANPGYEGKGVGGVTFQ